MNFFVKKGQSNLQAILSGFDTLTQELADFEVANTEAQEALRAQLDAAIEEGNRANRVLEKLTGLIK